MLLTGDFNCQLCYAYVGHLNLKDGGSSSGNDFESVTAGRGATSVHDRLNQRTACETRNNTIALNLR